MAYLTRLSWTFNGGLIAFFVGIILLLVPDQWTPWRTASVILIGAVILFEIYSVVNQTFLKTRFPEFWLPDHDKIAASIYLEEPDEISRSAAGSRRGESSSPGDADRR